VPTPSSERSCPPKIPPNSPGLMTEDSGAPPGLAVEEIGDGGSCFRLQGLVGIDLDLHNML